MSINTTTAGGLTESQKQFFHEEGYLVLHDLFTDADLQPAIDDITAQIDLEAENLVETGQLSSTFTDMDFAHRLAQISKETDQVALSLWNGVMHEPGFFALIANPKLLDVAESLCGEELIASSVYRLRPKIPDYNYSAVPWHQDSAYFEPYCDKALVLTVWIPLVDTTADNGCLWVIPGAHKGEVVAHHPSEGKAYLEIRPENLPNGEQVCCPVPKGGALLMHNRLPHGSFENKTEAVRWSMDLRYQSASYPTNAPITRMPGEEIPRGDSIADPEFVPTACFPPEADFLVRSTARPDQTLRTAEQFADLRATHKPTPATDRWGRWWEGEANRAMDEEQA